MVRKCETNDRGRRSNEKMGVGGHQQIEVQTDVECCYEKDN